MQRHLQKLLLTTLAILGTHAWASLPSAANLAPEIEDQIFQEQQDDQNLDMQIDEASVQVAGLGDFFWPATPSSQHPQKSQSNCRAFVGLASWYGAEMHGHPTANGERFNPAALTAAHRRLPFGSNVRVTNLSNGRQVVVRINDRGPFVGGRIIDLSRAAARLIGMGGTSRVALETCP